MTDSARAGRLLGLPTTVVNGVEVTLARGLHARALGLAFIDREQAGSGLLIPRCSSVHTFGMRFALDLAFLDREGAVLLLRRGVPRRRLVSHRAASAVLETPAAGGDIERRPG
jgi:uncharacterized membrane protein (UPF0127 family)